MGIKDLSKYIRDNTNVYTKKHLSDFYGKKVAVDISVFLHKTIKTSDNWILSMLCMFRCLKKYGIKIVCVFDGPNAPPEKLKERAKRKETSQKTQEKAILIESLIDEMGKLPNRSIPLDLRGRIENACKKQRDANKYTKLDYRDFDSTLKLLKETLIKFQKQCSSITIEHANTVKKIATILGMAVMQADGEAETLCAYMCVKGMVDAVLTEDTDVLAYETPLFLSKLDTREESVMVIEYSQLIKSLELTPAQFKDFCIMCSCDYNDRIKLPSKKGKKQSGIGPVKAMPLLKEHGDIDNIAYIMGYDVAPLNHERCRVLFTIPSMYDDIVLPYNKPIDTILLMSFLIENGCKYMYSSIVELWSPIEMVFLDENEETPKETTKIEIIDLSPQHKVGRLLKPNNIEIYTDGSCLGNPGPGGWSAILFFEGKKEIIKGGADHTTNNVMEMTAVIESLDFVRSKGMSGKIVVYTDSKYVMNGIESWIKGWKKNGWKTSDKKDVKNKDLWIKLDELHTSLNVKVEHVKGHSANEYNNEVDKIARASANTYK